MSEFPAWKTIVDDALRSGWNISEPYQLLPVSSEFGINSQNLVIETTHQKFLLKSMPREAEDSFEENLGIQDFAAQAGAPVPGIYRTSNTNRLCLASDQSCWALMQFIEAGNNPRYDRIELVASALAALHVRLEDCPIIPRTKTRYHLLDDAEIRQIQDAYADGDHDFQVDWSDFWRYLEHFSELNRVISPPQTTHLDCHTYNLIFANDESVFIVDFGHVQNIDRMLAIAFCCHRFASWNSRLVRRFYDAYQAIQPLANGEVAGHYYFVAWEAIRRICFLLRENFFHRNPQWNFELPRQLSTLRKSLELLNPTGFGPGEP